MLVTPRCSIGESDAQGQVRREYVYLGMIPVAQIDIDSQGQESVVYFLTDQLATPRLGIDQGQAVVWKWESDAYGSIGPSGSATINLRFGGQYFDAESGWYYNWNRYYLPREGRYLTSDPIGRRGGINAYAYVGGNPLNAADPFGLIDIFIGGAGDGWTDNVYRYYERYKNEEDNRTVLYYEWDDADRIMNMIRQAKKLNPCEPINLVGHSWGGDTAADVAAGMGEEGINIDLLALIDPVGRSPSEIGANVVKTVNVGSFPAVSNGFDGDAWASIGGQWGTGYWTPFNHNDFPSMMGWYPSPGGKSALDELRGSKSGCECRA